ncbi:MAG: tetratricopeptide repeat protein [Pirellulales bacterium]
MAACWIGCLTLTAGCQLTGRDGTVSRNVMKCRELSQVGISALDRGDTPEAERLLAEAVDTCGSDAEARRYYAEALWQRGARDAALEQLGTAVRLSTDDAPLFVRLAEMQLELGRFEPARENADRAVDLDPHSTRAWVVRARIKEQTGRLRDALADYHRALSFEPNDAETLLRVAELHRRLNEPRRALATLQSLRETYPPGEEPPQVMLLMGMTAAALGRYEEAASDFDVARQRGDNSPDTLYLMADAQHRAGHSAQAQQLLDTLGAVAPQHPGYVRLANELRLGRGGPASNIAR